MTTRNFNPRTIYENQREIRRAQPVNSSDKYPFNQGAFQDLDPSLIPDDALHEIKNYRCHKWGLLARGGSQRLHNVSLPPLPGRTGYSLTKSENVVTKTVGANFLPEDIGNYVVYDDGTHERIIDYISTSQVVVSANTPHSPSTNAYIRGQKNARLFHEKKRVHILHIDTRLFYCQSVVVDEWKEIHKSGIFPPPLSEESTLEPYDDYATLKNGGGLFKIDLDNFLYWKMNSEIPTVRITDVPQSPDKPYARNVIYTCGRLSGGITLPRDRYTKGVIIQQETGAVAVDSSGKDFGQVYTERPVGDGSTTFSRKICASLQPPYDTPTAWASIDDGSFKIAINGEMYEIFCDFTGVTSMGEIAQRIQNGLRDKSSYIEVEFIVDFFCITNTEEGGTLSHIYDGVSGTNIAPLMRGLEENGGDLQNLPYTMPVTYGNLELPVDPVTELYDAHLNIYSIYTTLNIGKGGKNPISGELNNSQLYVWQKDIPVAKAFLAYRLGYDVYAEEGTFENCDVGSKLRFMDGTEILIFAYIDSQHVVSYDSGTIVAQPAAIGGDSSLGKPIRVMNVTQQNDIITKVDGDSFNANDKGRIIFWPDGSESHVIEFIDSGHVRVKESANKTFTPCCIEPKTRKYTDFIRDEIKGDSPNLRSRISADYILQTRFFTPMPSGNIGKNTASLFTCAMQGGNLLYYCAADVNYRYQAGYYYAHKQREIFQDAIYSITECGDSLSIKCAKSTRAISINQFNSYIIEQAGIAILVLIGQKMVDEKIGIKHHGAVCVIERSLQLVITSEPAIRIFDGNQYGENLADGRIQKVLEGCEAAYAMAYSPIDGVHIWMQED